MKYLIDIIEDLSTNSNVVRFIIPSDPIPLSRHKYSGHHMYDPQKREKRDVGYFMLKTKPKRMLVGCIFMKITTYHAMPMKWSQGKKDLLAGTFRPIRPDKSNLCKFYEDVMQDIGVFRDDAQIVASWEEKLYDDGNGSRVEIFLKEISNEARKANTGQTI